MYICITLAEFYDLSCPQPYSDFLASFSQVILALIELVTYSSYTTRFYPCVVSIAAAAAENLTKFSEKTYRSLLKKEERAMCVLACHFSNLHSTMIRRLLIALAFIGAAFSFQRGDPHVACYTNDQESEFIEWASSVKLP